MILAIILWTAVIAVAIYVEANTSALVSMWFIPAGLVSLVLAIFKVDFIWQFVAFAAVSVICLVLSRTLFKKLLHRSEALPGNVERLTGMDALVISDIPENGFGQVKVDGKIWRGATLDNTEARTGEILTVHHVESTRIYCTKKQ